MKIQEVRVWVRKAGKKCEFSRIVRSKRRQGDTGARLRTKV